MGVDWVGKKGKKLESVLESRIIELKKMMNMQEVHNQWLCDQVLLWHTLYALKHNKRKVSLRCTHISKHASTNASIIEKITGIKVKISKYHQ